MGVVLSDPRGSVTKHRYLKKKGSVPATIPAPPLVAGECVICDKAFKNKPLVLVLEYQPTGKDCRYQDESKATCVAGSYPSPTRVEVENGQGDSQVFDSVKEGTILVFFGPFVVSKASVLTCEKYDHLLSFALVCVRYISGQHNV